MSANLDRLPPQALDYERAVLSACLLDADAVDATRGRLTPESFYLTAHRHVWTAICALHDRGEAVDVLTVRAEMEKAGTLEQAGGAVALAQLAGEVGTSANVEYHAALVRDAYVRRALIVRADRLTAAAYDPATSTEDLLNAAAALAPTLDTGSRGIVAWQAASDVIWPALESLEDSWKAPGEIAGVPTGLKDLDDLTNGLQAGDMVTVAARPSTGKTALGLMICWNASPHVPVGFVSVEMSVRPLATRLLALVARVDSQDLRRGRLGPEQRDAVGRAARQIAERPIHFSETLREPGHIAREARRLKREKGIGLLVIDYLQLLDPVRGKRADNREQEVSAISRAIKNTARDLNVPVLALAQLNRESERRTDKRPILADLRDSGSIEADSDVVILLHRPARYGVLEQAGEDVTHLLEAHIAKQRNGPTGTVKLFFNEAMGLIGNWGGQP